MRRNYDDCLERGKIKPFSRGKGLAAKELEAAGEDLSMEQGVRSDNDHHSRFRVEQPAPRERPGGEVGGGQSRQLAAGRKGGASGLKILLAILPGPGIY